MRGILRWVLCAAVVAIPLNASAAVVVDTFVRSSECTAEVTFLGPLYEYNYTVYNTSTSGWLDENHQVWVTPTIVDFEIPLGGQDYASNIQSPEGWDYELLSAADYELAFGIVNPYDAPWILHWYTQIQVPTFGPQGLDDFVLPNPIFPGNSLSGFILESVLSPVDGPYLTSWFDQARNIGDPPLPGGSPVGGGTVPGFPTKDTVVPEPATLSLLGLGLAGMAFRRFRK